MVHAGKKTFYAFLCSFFGGVRGNSYAILHVSKIFENKFYFSFKTKLHIYRALEEISVAETATGFRRFREFRSAVPPTFLTEDVLRDLQDGQVSGIRSFGEKNSLIICPFLGVIIP